MHFSFLIPTRGRPAALLNCITSIFEMCDAPNLTEVIVYVDDDDKSYSDFNFSCCPNVKVVKGPRQVLSQCWNICAEHASGEFLFCFGDDVVVRTQGWDTLFLKRTNLVTDKIGFFFCDDGFWGARFAAHFCITRTWVDVIGRFVPPYFPSDYNDLWLDEIANRIGRKFFVPGVLFEHLHPNFGKATLDQTHLERLERQASSNLQELYQSLLSEREGEAEKLRSFTQTTLSVLMLKLETYFFKSRDHMIYFLKRLKNKTLRVVGMIS